MSGPPEKTAAGIAKKFRLPLWLKILMGLAGLAVAYTLAGFYAAPAIIKSQLIKRLPALTKRQAAIREVTFNPFTLELAMRGLALTETNGEVFAGFDEFHLQFEAMNSISRHTWVFQDITLTHPFAHVVRRKDGSFNFDNLAPTNAAAPTAKPGPPAVLPAVSVHHLAVSGASLEADDFALATAFHDKIEPINLQLADFAIQFNASSVFQFSAATDTKELFTATGKLGVQPFQVAGNVKVKDLDLQRYGPYVALFTRAILAAGKMDAGADYQLTVGSNGPDVTVTNGVLQLTDMRIKAPDSGETVVSIPALAVQLKEASLRRMSAHFTSIKSSGGSMLVRQNHDGTINVLALLPNSQAAPTNAPSATNAAPAPMRTQIDEIAFDNYSAGFEDLKPKRPVKLDVSALAFSIKGFDSASNAPLATAASMKLNGQAGLSLNGTFTPAPMSGDVTLELSGLELPAFMTYMPSQIHLVLSQGQLNVRGRAHGELTTVGLAGNFAGDVSVKNIATADALHDRDLVKFDELAVKGIEASYPPVKLKIGEVALSNFSANIVIDTNRQINLLGVISNDGPKLATTSASAAAPLPPVDLGALVLDKVSLHYVDESIQPTATFDLQELNGTIKNLSTQPKGPAQVDLRGKMDQFSPFSVAGTVEPEIKDITLNLAVTCQNIDLTPMGPYMEKYGGYPINRGKLALQLGYDVERRKLTATNKIVVADLTLGAKNSSTNATHLPIKLGVALLKDRQGKISLDVPLSGSLDDPNFKVGPIIWKVVQNLLLKAASSPFTLLGRVLGGGAGEELSSVDFAPGEAALAPVEKDKLKKLAKALYERPALTLQIAGACAPAADGAILARRHLERRVNKLFAEEQAAAGQPAQSVESIHLEPADYARLLQKLYEKTYGPISNAVTASNAPPSAATPAPAAAVTPVRIRARRPQVARQTAIGLTRGGEKLMEHEGDQRKATRVVAAKSVAASGPATAPTEAAAVAVAPSGTDAAQMEKKLLADIHATDDELRELEQARARAVQAALLEAGQIAPERVFILAPKAINQAAQGETRANFSLE